MKRNVFYPLALAVISFTITSCEPTEVEVKCLLTHLNIHEKWIHNGNVFGDTINLQITYNAEGQLTEFFEQYEKVHVFSHFDNYGRLIRLKEFWNGTLEFELRVTWINFEVTITFFERTEGGDFEQVNSKMILKLNTDQQIIRINYYDRPTAAGAWELYAYILNTWQNNNLTEQEIYSLVMPASVENEKILKPKQEASMFRWWHRNLMPKRKLMKESISESFPRALELEGTITITYDDYKSPFANQFVWALLLDDPRYLSANNVLSYTEVWVGDPPFIYNYIYTYNAEGYPITRSMDEITQWGQFIESWNFTYECN